MIKDQLRAKFLACAIILAFVLNSCGTKMPSVTSAPVVVSPNPVSVVSPNPVSVNAGTQTFVNILIDSVKFKGTVSNTGNEGNLQLFTVVSDDAGHADALICPYGGVKQVHQGDQVNPCQAGLTYPEDLLQNHLYVMLIAVDVKDKSALADIGFSTLSSAISEGLVKAVFEAAAVEPETLPVAIGSILISTVIGYAGNKAQEYFQQNYVIGSQSFVVSRKYNWNNGQVILAPSTNNQVDFEFTVKVSSTAEGEVVKAAPAPNNEPATSPPPAPISQSATSAPTTQPVNTEDMSGKWKITLNVSSVIPGDGVTGTCVSPKNVIYDFNFNLDNAGNLSGYYSLPPAQGMNNYGQYPFTGKLSGNQFSFTSSMTNPSDDCNGNINLWQGLIQNGQISGSKTMTQKGKGYCCTYVGNFTGIPQN